MRNPAECLEKWPQLEATMAPLRDALLQQRVRHPVFEDLVGCCGNAPSRTPPSEEEVASLCQFLEKVMNLDKGISRLHHPASTLKYGFIEAVQSGSCDPDTELPRWAKEGAPMGITAEIPPGGLFPLHESKPTVLPEDLELLLREPGNHPSFDKLHGEAVAPGGQLMQDQVEQGFGVLYRDRERAKEALGGPVVPAPLGNIAKQKSDGSWKHRLIQDLRRNGVNDTVQLHERQVLPRPIDHARGVAKLCRHNKDSDNIKVLVLDFKNAFMTMPLAAGERRFNCAEIPAGIKRKRDVVEEGEAESGTLVAWRVLGFGGKPNPLVYSRLASFLMRTAQALVGSPTHRRHYGDKMAMCRGQLYVDDPIWALRGSAKNTYSLRAHSSAAPFIIGPGR